MKKTKLSGKFYLALVLFGLMGQIAWVVENMYLNVFMYKMFDAKPGDISLMVAASAVAAALTTVFMGALADKLGKRKVFISAGYILWGISIFCFVFLRTETLESIVPLTVSASTVGISLTIILDCVMTFFGSTANDAAYNAWLTDSTDETNRGSAEGINAMMPLVAILAVFGGFMAFDLNDSQSWVWIFSIIGGLVLLIGIAGFFLIKEPNIKPSESGYFKNLLYGFLPGTVKKNPAFYFFLFAFVVFNISIQIFMPYLIIYYEVSLGMADYVFVMAPAIILASAVTAFWGKVYDKKGFSFGVFFSLLWLVAGYLLLFFTETKLPVFIGSLLMMCGYLSGMAVFGAKIRDLTPAGKAGMLQGVRIVAQVLLPGVIGPFIGKLILADAEMKKNDDGTESFIPSADIFMAALVVILVLIAILLLVYFIKKPRTKDLTTPFEETLSPGEAPWQEYPRPQLRRSSYHSLNGKWNLSLVKKGVSTPLGEIVVPFVPESRLSGIHRSLKKGESYCYKKSFIPPSLQEGESLILHFGAIDQVSKVFLNGKAVGEHIGGYLPFSFDITPYLTEKDNQLTVLVEDTLDRELAYGKQRKKRGGMWYTPISGIWQSVWMEAVPQEPITALTLSPTLDSVTITTKGGKTEKTLFLHLPEGDKSFTYEGDVFTLPIEDPKLWTPETPHLYDFTLISGKDRVDSYFALRTVTTETVEGKTYLALNGKPYYFHGLLDQGYYSDGIYLPATAEGYRFDILKMKALGFNMLRKHIKIEPDLFYYYCDKYGMAVFQDMVNSGKYSFLIDTALPTVGIQKGISHKASKRRRDAFEKDAKDTLSLLYNHPSVVYYTVFNEGWGQYDADETYEKLKALDPSRIFDATSGWFCETKSDVDSYHVYFKKLALSPTKNRPLVLSEFGGYSYKIADHAFNLDKTYGYRFFDQREDFERALVALYRKEVMPLLEKGLSATVYTQVSDVEDETNGLVTYDRHIVKVDEAEMQALAGELQKAFQSQFMAKE